MFIGRGSIEAVDRAWIMGHYPVVWEVSFVSSAASLENGVEPGSCNAPLYTVAIGDPSVSYAGLAKGFPVAHEDVTSRISSTAAGTGCHVVTRLNASIPYLYMETRRLLEYLSSIGVSTIDMELAYVLRIFNALGRKPQAC
ncbi:MAG: hypothetical protein F7C32_01105 [Desulfurococcales archaeon]|nr:hypothetical protein [Desulfurococcales archaeon]